MTRGLPAGSPFSLCAGLSPMVGGDGVSDSPGMRKTMPRPALPRPMTLVALSLLLGLGSLAACGGGGGEAGGGGTPGLGEGPAPTVQELQCQAAGWQRLRVRAAGQDRLVLWKAPVGVWPRGALLVMHGGGGAHTNFCVANVALTEPQVRFTSAALAAGMAVFLLDSTDRVTDNAGRPCGKVWDDEVRPRENLDLPFIDEMLGQVLPQRRPAGSHAAVFLAGHSSGGYMAVRAATRFNQRVTAFALVGSGDPYGWYRDCTPRSTDRPNVFGAGFDRETGRQIVERDACRAERYPNEQPWEAETTAARPGFRAFHHENDGINDLSCMEKVSDQLVRHGYPRSPALRLTGGQRSADLHYWLDAYNQPMLEFFAGFVR